MPDVPLSGSQIRQYLLEVADALPASDRQEILLAGGSLLAMHNLRETTVDADSLSPMTPELKAAAAVVAEAHGLPAGWLNDRAAMFRPATLRVDDCETLVDHPQLLVLGAPLRQVFLMKLYAFREPDRDDLLALWPHTGFTSPAVAAREFELAYPHLERDPYLADLISNLIESL